MVGRGWFRVGRTGPAFVAAVVASALAMTLSACAASPALTVTDAWVRAAAPGSDASAGFLSITNATPSDDRLVKVSSPGADAVMIHATTTDASGMTGMSPVAVCLVPAKSTTRFEPGGMHLMVMGLHAPLALGATLELDLTFEHAGTIVVQADVR
jgi:copper(I)-binding protein